MSRSRRKGFPWFRLIAACVVIAGAAAVYYYVWGPGSLPVVRAVKVTRGDLRAELSATAVVKAEEIQISSEAPARIEAIPVRENERVRRGQVLVLLDRASLEGYVKQAQADLASAEAQARGAEQAVEAEAKNARGAIAAADANLRGFQAQLARLERGARPEEIATAEARTQQAQAHLDQARADLARVQKLHQDGAVSAQALDQARTAVDVSTAELNAAREQQRLVREGARSEDIDAARAQVAAARATAAQAAALDGLVDLRRREAQAARAQVAAAKSRVRIVESDLDKAEIRSPIDATVVRIDAKPGEVAYPGTPVMSIYDLSQTWVEAEIDDVDVDKIRVGQEVNVLAEAFPGREFKGRVFEISKSAKPKLLGRVRAKIVPAKIRLLEPAPLTAEMEVDIESRPIVARAALLVPNEAIQSEGDDTYVFALRGDRVRRTPVEVGQRNFERTEIMSALREGQLVVLPGETRLRDGQRVRVERRRG
jgi:HlyD family secretion protein